MLLTTLLTLLYRRYQALSSFIKKRQSEFYNKYPEVNTMIKIGTYEELSTLLNNNSIDLLWTFDDPITNANWSKALELPNVLKIIATVCILKTCF